MLAIQAADCMLYLPEDEVASLTPVYPDRWRVVTASGRVGHIPRLSETRFWTQLGTGWVHPRHLTRQNDHWRDPAGFLYPHQPLQNPDPPEESARGIRWLSHLKQKAVWATDDGDTDCDTKFNEALSVHPDLIRIDSRTAVHRLRIRHIAHGSGKRKITLDSGHQLLVMPGYMADFCQALGLDSPSEIDLSVPSILYELREYPYDLTTAAPAQLLQDFSGPRPLLLGLIWQTVLQNPPEESDLGSFYEVTVQTTLARAGWEMNREAVRATLDYFIVHNALFTYRRFGYRDALPDRRSLGSRRPDVILLGGDSARQAAADHGLSYFDPALWMGVRWEYFVEILRAAGVDSVRLFNWDISAVNAVAVQRHLARLEMEVRGPIQSPGQDLNAALAQEPPPSIQPPPAEAQAPQRIAVQAHNGLLFFRLDEIAAITSTPPNRWRIVDKSGAVGYRPDRPEAAPWVRPEFLTDDTDPAGFHHPGPLPENSPCLPPADPVLLLERRKSQAVWLHTDGSEIPTNCSLEKARLQHGALVRVTSDCYINRQHLTAIGKQYKLVLSNGETRNPGNAHHARELARQLGLANLWSLDPREELFHYNFHDYPYDILAAPAERLQSDFSRAVELMSAAIWQQFCTRSQGNDLGYGDTFRDLFYSLQPALHRAGFMRAPADLPVTKEPLYLDFGDLIWKCVYRYRLFNYKQFGFKDPRPHKRFIGSTRPGTLLMVEKGNQIEEYAERLHRELGISVIIFGGSPKLIDIEYLTDALQQVYSGEITPLAYVDHDWSGSLIGPAAVRQLAFYGYPSGPLQTVITPECFHPNELALNSHPVYAHSTGEATLIANWMAQGGGINGEKRGIHANWLFPYERVRQRVEELL